MNTTMSKQWYAVSTRPGWEKRVAESLEKKRWTSYCPLNRTNRSWSDRRKAHYEPLFPSVVFVFVSREEHEKIREVDGVVNFIHWLNAPAVISPEEIDTIRKFLSEYEHVSLEKESVNLNEKVRIINGPLMMWEGKIVQIRTNMVKIMLPSLGYSLVAQIQEASHEPVRPLAKLDKKAV